MAYSQYVNNTLDNPVQYYSEDYDYPTYYQTIPELRHNHQVADTSTNKRFKNNLPTVSYVNERCPIYVHPVHRYEKYPTYDLNIQKQIEKSAVEINNPKSVLDKLEETYWATWKPKKDVKPIKIKHRSKNKAFGDHEEEIIKYFSAKNFETSSASVVVDKNDNIRDNSKKCPKKSSKSLEQRKNRKQREKEVDSQEIQTDLPMILPKIEETVDASFEKCQEVAVRLKSADNVPVRDVKSELQQNSTAPHEKPQDEEEDKTIKHTDSFILTKRKQNNPEPKPHFQQPRSIRLFKKPGATSSSYLKGGSYPLKSCLKKQPSPRGNFRLGAPGSSLFVTTSSYNKKNKR